MEIREHWEKFIKKYPGLKKDRTGIPTSFEIAQEAHAAGWLGGEAAGRIAEHKVIQEAAKVEIPQAPKFLMSVDGRKRFMTTSLA